MANGLLEEVFLPEINRRFSIRAREQTDLHRVVERGCVLEEVLCVIERRVVGKDLCVRWRNRWLQIDTRRAGLAGKRVTVKQLAGGRLVVDHQGERLSFTELKSGSLKAKRRKTILNNRQWKPAASHPWTRAPACGAPLPASPAPAAPARAWQAGKRKTG